jgi:hypothetical protein
MVTLAAGNVVVILAFDRLLRDMIHPANADMISG